MKEMEPIIIKKSIKKDLLTVLGSLVFVAIGVFIISTATDAKRIFFGWASIIFFGFGALFMIALDIKMLNKPFVIIKDDSVEYFTMKGYHKVSFPDVKYFYILKNEVIGFYSKMPANKLKTDLGGFPLKGMNITMREFLHLLTERLKAHGAEEIY